MDKSLLQHGIIHVMVITDTSLKRLTFLKTMFLFVKIRSIQRPPADLKHAGVLIKLYKEKSDIKDEISRLVGVLLKSPNFNNILVSAGIKIQ